MPSYFEVSRQHVTRDIGAANDNVKVACINDSTSRTEPQKLFQHIDQGQKSSTIS